MIIFYDYDFSIQYKWGSCKKLLYTSIVSVLFSKEGLRLGGSLAQFDRHGTPVDPSGCGYLWCLLAKAMVNE